MNRTESSAATSLQMDWMRHGATLGFMGMGLFFMLGLAGLALQGLADPKPRAAYQETSTSQSNGTRGAGELEPVVLAWTVEMDEEPFVQKPSASIGTPLVLISEGLAQFKSTEGGAPWLLLEPDGTLRTESDGTLVGFLQGGKMPELGDPLTGSGLIDFRLLHQDSWLSAATRVPIVESDGSEGWIVTGHRWFGIEVTRDPEGGEVAGLGKPRLHPRTGLPQVELAPKRG